MRLFVVTFTTLVCLPGVAWSGSSADATLATTLVSGPTAPASTTATDTGTVRHDAVWNPALRVGLSASVRGTLGDKGDASVGWGVYRDQVLCDTCDDGDGPGWVGNEVLGSTDLSASAGRSFQIAEQGSLRLAAEAVLPASRDALFCNPFYGAPGASASLLLPAGATTLQTSVRASRPIHRFDSVPVGACAPALGVSVRTLTGTATPTPWDGEQTGVANPTFTGSAGLAWIDPHVLVKAVPDRFTSSLSAGIDAQRDPVDPAAHVSTLTGASVVAPSFRPVTASLPWSVAAGWSASDRFDLRLTLSNRLPTWLADPGGALRALPARTAVTASVTGHL